MKMNHTFSFEADDEEYSSCLINTVWLTLASRGCGDRWWRGSMWGFQLGVYIPTLVVVMQSQSDRSRVYLLLAAVPVTAVWRSVLLLPGLGPNLPAARPVARCRGQVRPKPRAWLRPHPWPGPPSGPQLQHTSPRCPSQPSPSPSWPWPVTWAC